MSKLFVMKIPAADPLINKPRGERYGGKESGREDKRGKMERGKRKGEDGTKRRWDEMRWGKAKEGIVWTVLKERWRYELRRQRESERVKAAHRTIRKYRNMKLLLKILNGKNPIYFHFKI
jgi:hypothetical protein